MPDYRSFDCSETELLQHEVKLKQDGFRLTNKTNEKDLQPKEYFKRSYSGTTTSFEGPIRWSITCRIQ